MQLLFFKIKRMPHRMLVGVIAAVLLVTLGCATPVGVSRVSEKAVYKQIDSSVLTSNTYSSYTAVVLHRHGLQEGDFENDPGKFIRHLHEIATKDGRRDLLLALSELCFLAAQQAEADLSKPLFDSRELYSSPIETNDILPAHEPVHPRTYYMGSAVYAYLFIMGPGDEPPPGSFDRRFRLACDLYNRGLANMLVFIEGKIDLSDKTLPLPVGEIHITIKTIKMPWDTAELETVLPADSFEVHGLSVRNRVPGVGAPILAVRKKGPGKPVSSAVPATVFVEIKGGLEDINTGNCSGEVSLYSTMSESEIMVNNKKVPLETDLTAPIAYSLNDPILWSLGLNLIRMGRSLFDPGIYPVQPYEPGLIPIVLVHGTASSPVWWAEMLNTLRSDPQIRKHFQIWLYLYDSGKPVVFSANHLRESIENKIKKCDPSGQDPALKNIVVIGHSQGGLLTRYTAIETGDAIVKAILGKSLDELDLSPKELELVKRYAVIHPLPEVRRVIFISTPHRGSILASNFVRRMAMRFINLPREFVQTGTDLLNITERFSPAGKLKASMARTSIDSMSPDNPALLAVAELPFPPGIKGHSIIAINGDEQPPAGNDGVVAYTSAHIEGVESEMVVRDGHSCQGNPVVIEEVRRILIEHLHDLGMDKEADSKL
jgi:pimeloyl-ACP methyl ester carboxylesterase